MKKIKEYKSVMNDKVGIRINGNESYKNKTNNKTVILIFYTIPTYQYTNRC